MSYLVILDKASKIRSLINEKKLKEAAPLIKELREESYTGQDLEIRNTQVSWLMEKFKDVLNSTLEKETKERNTRRDDFIRQMSIIDPDFESKHINWNQEELLLSQPLFRNAMLHVSTFKLAEIQERHNQMVGLSHSVRELNQLFIDFSLLVESQGDVIINIGNKVDSASENVLRGEEQLKEAVSLQKAVNKKSCCILGILLAVVGTGVGLGVGLKGL